MTACRCSRTGIHVWRCTHPSPRLSFAGSRARHTWDPAIPMSAERLPGDKHTALLFEATSSSPMTSFLGHLILDSKMSWISVASIPS